MADSSLVGPPRRELADEFELAGPVFKSRFPMTCVLDSNHRQLKGKPTARVRRADNPMSVQQGYACSECVERIVQRS